ncbi:MAG: hypothetical protein R3C20_12485 [Planctomycetaceae bacterium]
MKNLMKIHAFAFRGRLRLVIVMVMYFAIAGSVHAQTASDYLDIYKASLAIDHIRDLRFGSGDRSIAKSHSGSSVVSRLGRQNSEAPPWDANTLLNGASNRYQLWIYKDYGFNKLNFSIFSDTDTMFVTFYGTTDQNWQGNIALPVVNPAYDNSATHAGWAAMAYDNYAAITKEMSGQGAAGKRIIMTGHSQGGAVAGHLMYLALKNKYLNQGKAHRLITFGAPRYGTPSFRENFNRHLRSSAPQTKAFDVEIEEDPKTTLWTDIINLGLSNEHCFTGTRIRRPKAFSGKTLRNDDPHNHLYYVWVARNLAYADSARPTTDIPTLAVARTRQLAEPGDKFSVSEAGGTSGKVTVQLQAHDRISWWKGLKIYKNGTMVKELYTQDGRRSDHFALDVQPGDSCQVEFCKAKAFGAHTNIRKHSIDLYAMRGKTVTFQWTND